MVMKTTITIITTVIFFLKNDHVMNKIIIEINDKKITKDNDNDLLDPIMATKINWKNISKKP